MQIRKLMVPALVLGAAVLAAPASAQTVLPLSFEVRGGVVLPQGDFNDVAGTGWSVGGTVHYGIAPNVSIYGGFEHARFSADSVEESDGVDANLTDDGFRLGARFAVPMGAMTGLSPWVEGGATLNKTTIHISDTSGGGSVGLDSDRSVGYEVGAGLSFAVAPKIAVTPGVRWRSHTAKFADDDDAKLDVNHFTVDLGVHIRL